MEQVDIQVLGVEPGDEELAGSAQMNGAGRGCRQRAMPQLNELDAARIAFVGIVEDFIRLHVHKAQAHGAIAHDTLQMPASTAAAISLARVERNDDMTAFPDAFLPGINPETDTVAEGPDADQPVKIAARGRQ